MKNDDCPECAAFVLQMRAVLCSKTSLYNPLTSDRMKMFTKPWRDILHYPKRPL